MKTQLLKVLTAVILLLIPTLNFAVQAPPLGTAADFALFTNAGAVTNIGTYKYLTHVTGNVGSNTALPTNFGNINGVVGGSAACATDMQIAFDSLSAAIPTDTLLNPVIGNDTTLHAGVYFIPGAATLDSFLTLDAQGNANAVFIFKMPASPVFAFSTSANSKIKLINKALACNVFWQISGAVNIGPGTTMRGTIISASGAINMTVGDTLEGRALTIAGAVTVDNGNIGALIYTPNGCGSQILTGPKPPTFVESKDFAVFAGIGPVTDDGTSHITGDVGTNGSSDLTTGYDPLKVTGTIHPIPDDTTAAAAADLLKVVDTLNVSRPFNIELLDPSEFGFNLVLTPHTYEMNSAVSFNDTLYLNAMGNINAIFIIRTNGAFATVPGAKVILINGTQAKNVFWMVNGAVSIASNSVFKGTIIANNGAIDVLPGAKLIGRALTTNGAITTTAMTDVIPSPPKITTEPVNKTVCAGDSISFTVVATGLDLTYQWRKGVTNIPGATSDTLTINPVSISDANPSYYVIVSGASTPNDTSINVSLTVNTAPDITTAPVNQTVCDGSSASFSVVATGTAPTYQWRKGVTNISGKTSATLTIDPVATTEAAINYNVVVSGTCAPAKTSSNVSLTVNTAPSITTQPANQTEVVGSSASFSVVAIGTGLTYQWRKGTVNITSANSATLTIDPVAFTDAATNYNVVVTGTCSPAKTSDDASFIVNTTGIGSTSEDKVVFYPNPFNISTTLMINDASQNNKWELRIYNVLGKEVLNMTIRQQSTVLKTNILPSGLYFYKVIGNDKTIQSGKLISK